MTETVYRLLVPPLREELMRLPEKRRDRLREIRLRLGYPMSVLEETGESVIGCVPVRREELMRLLDRATDSSPYAAEQSLAQGFITVEGGVRIGLCGLHNTCSRRAWSFGSLTSVCIRLPHEIIGCARGVIELPFSSTLILAPPGGGKTTLLRDAVRLLSEHGCRVAVCDDRGEIAAQTPTSQGFRLGAHTDILTGCPKAAGSIMLLRAMNPEILAMDEITAPEDTEACISAANCGVRLLATAHGSSAEELHMRRIYEPLFSSRVFSRVIRIEASAIDRRYHAEALC